MCSFVRENVMVCMMVISINIYALVTLSYVIIAAGLIWFCYGEKPKPTKKEITKNILWPITFVTEIYNSNCPRDWEFELYENIMNSIFDKKKRKKK